MQNEQISRKCAEVKEAGNELSNIFNVVNNQYNSLKKLKERPSVMKFY
jgi:predicted nucleic-acid-binding Zn-ribbon protein